MKNRLIILTIALLTVIACKKGKEICLKNNSNDTLNYIICIEKDTIINKKIINDGIDHSSICIIPEHISTDKKLDIYITNKNGIIKYKSIDKTNEHLLIIYHKPNSVNSLFYPDSLEIVQKE